MDLTIWTRKTNQASRLFKEIWLDKERNVDLPRYSTGVEILDFQELSEKIDCADQQFIERLVTNLLEGKSFIVKRVFSTEFAHVWKDRVHRDWLSKPSEFFKMVDGVQNFHREIGPDLSGNYYAGPVKHSSYFFPWNQQSSRLYEAVYPRWGYFKVIGGFSFDEYSENIPSDGMIDRIQIVNYPLGGGKIDTHFDPYHGMKPVLSTYLSKRGIDYEQGGFYVVEESGALVDVEDLIDVGDMSFTFPTVSHGVAPVDPDKILDWSNPSGRWWMGMFCVDSDLVKDRQTGGSYSPAMGSKVTAPEQDLLIGAVATVEPNGV